MATLGVDLDKLIRVRAETIEGVFEAVDRYLDQQEVIAQTHELKPLLIVWDSVGGTPAIAELEGSSEDKHMMVAARNIKMNLRRIHSRLTRCRAVFVCTNHFYVSPGQGFTVKKTYGGGGMQYFPSISLWLTAKGALKIGAQQIGHQVEAKVKKNRLGPSGATALAGLVHGRGFDNSFSLFDWAREHGAEGDHRYVAQRGAWYTFSTGPQDPDPVTFQRGFAGFGELLHGRSDLYEMLWARYLET